MCATLKPETCISNHGLGPHWDALLQKRILIFNINIEYEYQYVMIMIR